MTAVLDRIETKSREIKQIVPDRLYEYSAALSELTKYRETQAMQCKFGCGSPERAVAEKTMEIHNKFVDILEAKLATIVKPIHAPDPKTFFPMPDRWDIAGKADPPKLINATLEQFRTEVVYMKTNIFGKTKRYAANIPLIPMSALAQVQKVLNLMNEDLDSSLSTRKTVNFHLLFFPKWENRPAPADPVLLANIIGTDSWFELAAWGSDKDIIQEYIQPKDLGYEVSRDGWASMLRESLK